MTRIFCHVIICTKLTSFVQTIRRTAMIKIKKFKPIMTRGQRTELKQKIANGHKKIHETIYTID